MEKDVYFQNPTLQRVAKSLNVTTDLSLMYEFPRSEEFAEHLKETLATLKERIHKINNLLLIYDIAKEMGVDLERALVFSDNPNWKPVGER